MDAIDRDALERALAACRAESPGRAQQLDSMLQDESWERVARFASFCVQSRAMDLQPWQKPPVCYFSNLEAALREPYGDARGATEAAEVLRRLLDAGLSRYEPNPIAALERAEAEQCQK